MLCAKLIVLIAIIIEILQFYSFSQPNVVKRLVELITTEPSEDLPMNQRFRHANVASEILTM